MKFDSINEFRDLLDEIGVRSRKRDVDTLVAEIDLKDTNKTMSLYVSVDPKRITMRAFSYGIDADRFGELSALQFVNEWNMAKYTPKTYVSLGGKSNPLITEVTFRNDDGSSKEYIMKSYVEPAIIGSIFFFEAAYRFKTPGYPTPESAIRRQTVDHIDFTKK